MRVQRLTLAALALVLMTSPLLRSQAPAPAPATAETYTATLQVKGDATAVDDDSHRPAGATPRTAIASRSRRA